MKKVVAITLAAFGLFLSAPAANGETIDQLLADTPEAGERPIVSGLHDQGYGYLDYGMVSQAWDRTCWSFGGAHGASSIADYVAWYNQSRLMHRLGRVPPTEAEAHYYSEHVTDQPAGSQNPEDA